jgi:hypothetical protein
MFALRQFGFDPDQKTIDPEFRSPLGLNMTQGLPSINPCYSCRTPNILPEHSFSQPRTLIRSKWRSGLTPTMSPDVSIAACYPS